MTPQASHLSAHTDSRRAAPRRSSRLRAILLATSALASVALPATLAYAGDATWTPGSTDFNIGDNWTGTPDKTVPIAGTATFNASSQRAIVFTESTSVGGMTVTSGAGDYTFDTNNQNLTFTGAGLSVQGGASLTLNNSFFALTTFSGNSSAGASTITNDGTLLFNEESKAEVRASSTTMPSFSAIRVGPRTRRSSITALFSSTIQVPPIKPSSSRITPSFSSSNQAAAPPASRSTMALSIFPVSPRRGRRSVRWKASAASYWAVETSRLAATMGRPYSRASLGMAANSAVSPANSAVR